MDFEKKPLISTDYSMTAIPISALWGLCILSFKHHISQHTQGWLGPRLAWKAEEGLIFTFPYYPDRTMLMENCATVS